MKVDQVCQSGGTAEAHYRQGARRRRRREKLSSVSLIPPLLPTAGCRLPPQGREAWKSFLCSVAWEALLFRQESHLMQSDVRDWDVAQLVEWLPSMPEALGGSTALCKAGHGSACLSKVEAWRPKIQGRAYLRSIVILGPAWSTRESLSQKSKQTTIRKRKESRGSEGI